MAVVVLIQTMVLFGCARQPDEWNDDAVRVAEDYDEWLDALSRRPAGYTHPEVICSSTRIQREYDQGKLSEEDYYLLSIAAAYDPAQLPAVYRDGVDQDTSTDASWLLREIEARIDSFSLETQSRLRPYLLSCDDPESYWYDPDQQIFPPNAMQTQCPCMADMERPDTGGSYFRITGPAGTADQQEIVANALQRAYSAYAGIGFTEPTDWIRVSLQDTLSRSDGRIGEKWMAELEGRRRCHIAILTELGKERLEAVTAHELFHCFQDYIPGADNSTAGLWEWESTAVWAQEFVYPATNTEHEWYDDLRFSTFEQDFFSTGATMEYVSYLYWFYLYQKDGKTGGAVRNFLERIYLDGRQAAFSSRPDLEAEFKEYALWNLNVSPHTYYEDAGGEPSTRPFGGSVVYETVPDGERFYESIEIERGGIMYYVYTFDWNTLKVHFDLRQIQKTEENHSGIQVVYRADGRSYHEDVSFRDELVFCRNRPAEDIDAIIFIISNADITSSDNDSTLEGELVIDTRGVCIPEWTGSVNCSCSSSGPGDGTGTNLYGGSYTANSSGRLTETLVHDEDDDWLYAASKDVVYSSWYRWYVEYEPPSTDDSYTAWEEKTRSGSGSRAYEYDLGPDCPPDCPANALVITPADGDNASRYVHRSKRYSDLGTGTATHQVMNIAGELARMQGRSDELWTDEYDYDVSATIPTDSMLLHLTDNGSRLWGTLTDGSCSCNAEFVFE